MDIMAPPRPVKNFDGKNHLASPDTEVSSSTAPAHGSA